MKNYLEPLLQAQEEESEPADWSGLGRLPGGRRQRSGETAAGEGESVAETEENTSAPGLRRLSPEAGAVPEGFLRAAPEGTAVRRLRGESAAGFQPIGGSGRTEGPAPLWGQSKSGGAAWLYGQLRQSLASARVPVQAAGQPLPLEREGRVERGGEFSLEQADRLFQRDARRYDGEFTFY